MSAPQPPVGPFETERQALDTPAVRAVYDAFRASPRPAGMDSPNADMLTAACSAAGVELGAYDRRILGWLAGWEPQTCAVIAGLIARAAAGPASDAGRLAAVREVLDTFDWGHDDLQYFLEKIDRIVTGSEL